MREKIRATTTTTTTTTPPPTRTTKWRRRDWRRVGNDDDTNEFLDPAGPGASNTNFTHHLDQHNDTAAGEAHYITSFDPPRR